MCASVRGHTQYPCIQSTQITKTKKIHFCLKGDEKMYMEIRIESKINQLIIGELQSTYTRK